MPASPSSWIAPVGKVVEFSAPAFLGSEVAVAGMSSTIQCQKPLPVGASGSYIETTKLLVALGKPDHDSSGEMSLPPGTPKIPDSCATGSGCPFRTVVLTTLKEGTLGRNSYGFGRSRSAPCPWPPAGAGVLLAAAAV